MKTSTKLFFVLALVCFTAQASLLENLINSTKLRGKTVFNTTKGLTLDYDGGLTYTLGDIDIDLLSLGLNFNAEPEAQSSNGNGSTSYKYSGGISFSDATNTTTANVTITGLAKIANAVNVAYDNTTQTTTVNTTMSFSDTNSFTVKSGLYTVSGKGSESLGTSGTVVQQGDNVKVNQDTNLMLSARGNVINNGTTLGAYSALSTTTSNTDQEVTLHHNSWLPAATFTGSSGFDNQNTLSYQNTVQQFNKSGSVDFIGYSRVNSTGATNVRSGQGMRYNYDTSSSVNGTATGTSSVHGVGKVFTHLASNASANTSSFFNGGHIYQVSSNTDGSSQTGRAKTNVRGKLVEIFKAMGGEEKWFTHGHLPAFKNLTSSGSSYHSAFTTGWRAGYESVSAPISSSTTVTNVTIGGGYKARGIDTKNWKPWSSSGKEYVTTSFRATNLGGNANVVENVALTSGNNPSFENKLAGLQATSEDEKYMKAPHH
eukprot:CAMPEP_0176410088 /NCGR_PEP_ID=MMETSP0127-20121128/2861_1 /TAXON_ID=938130 /ORGANISM="Platyophrya macrostoma, Strain WH" /LENGTH=484 /DNA_ID=CAMNT_0017789543 /DNA_START=28 /DNA_END=1482 /DNA_ORIENTATION=-